MVQPSTGKKSFSAYCGDWARKRPEHLTAILRTSVTSLAERMTATRSEGGTMPVLTGNLRRSLLASTSGMPPTVPTPKKGAGSNPYDPGQVGQQVALVAAGLKMGQTLFLGFQANYAKYAEARNGFTRLAAQKWVSIVRASARLVENRYKSSKQ